MEKPKPVNIHGAAVLPVSVKSLAEIKAFHDTVVRATCFGILFEHLLKATTPNGKHKSLEQLVRDNNERLLQFWTLDDLRVIRNWIIHGDERLTITQVFHAESAFQCAIEGILESCPEPLKSAAIGIVETVVPSGPPQATILNQEPDPPKASPELRPATGNPSDPQKVTEKESQDAGKNTNPQHQPTRRRHLRKSNPGMPSNRSGRPSLVHFIVRLHLRRKSRLYTDPKLSRLLIALHGNS